MNLRPQSYINGTSAITCHGDSLELFFKNLTEKKTGHRSWRDLTYKPNHSLKVNTFKVPDFELDISLKPAVERRLGFLSRMCLQAAIKSTTAAQLDLENQDLKIGLIVGTAEGPSAVRENFNEKLFCHGPTSASPILFAKSVHNSIASFVALQLNIFGPTVTVVNGELSVASSINLANTWLSSQTVDHVILLIGDEVYDKELHYLCSKDYNILDHYNPLSPDQPVPGEGVAGFVLSNQPLRKNDSSIKISAGTFLEPHLPPLPEIVISDLKGISQSHSLGKRILKNSQVVSYNSAIGSFPTNGGIDIIIANEYLKNNSLLALTPQESNKNFNQLSESISGTSEAYLTQIAKHDEIGVVRLEKSNKVKG